MNEHIDSDYMYIDNKICIIIKGECPKYPKFKFLSPKCPDSGCTAQNAHGIRLWGRSILGYASRVGLSRGYAIEVRQFSFTYATGANVSPDTHVKIRCFNMRITRCAWWNSVCYVVSVVPRAADEGDSGLFFCHLRSPKSGSFQQHTIYRWNRNSILF